MKKFGKKLVLSGLALAATAATLSTTTYAWYVVNPEAQANGMTGATADATGSASVYVSKDGTKFSKTVTLQTTDYVKNSDLKPITCETVAGGFKTVDGADSTDYIQFKIWVKSDNDCTITPTLTVANITSEFTTQTAYQDVATNAASGSEFFVDAVQALRVDINETIYDVQKIAKEYEVAENSVTDETLSMDAHDYYTQIMGAAPTDVTPAGAEVTWANISLTANEAVELTFTFWLEGADDLCFDSCVGQDFTFLLDFVASNTGASGSGE